MEIDIEALLSQMTVEEKASMLAGSDSWHSTGVPRLGIPAFRMTDGPNGARGTSGNYGPNSACFPNGSALAATWNTSLVERVGAALADEVKDKQAHMLLAPTVNTHRSPIAGRNFECYSEDPFLAGEMACAYIGGLQKNGVSACIKHFVCNDQEFERHSISATVAERPLREIYLQPFRAAMKKVHPWAVMSAYNRINGVTANANDHTLREILKEEWGFDGAVISDWFGTYGPESVPGGLDLEMPGPGRWVAAENVKAALEDGLLSIDVLDDKVRRLLRLLARVGAFEKPVFNPEQGVDRPATRALIREAADEAAVLLKNDAILPMREQNLKRILVVGENAVIPQIVGGGSAFVNSHRVVSPLDGLRQRVGAGVEVAYALGCVTHRQLPAPLPAWLTDMAGQPGLTLSVFGNTEFSGEPILRRNVRRASQTWWGNDLPAPEARLFSAIFETIFTAPEDGRYTLGMQCIGTGGLWVDGQEVLPFQDCDDPALWNSLCVEMELRAGEQKHISLRYALTEEKHWRMLGITLLKSIPADPIAEAVSAAKDADVVIVVGGLTGEWEREEMDRVDMRLPLQQDALIARLAEANPNVVVVLNSGSPLEMPWLEQVKAVLQLWYPGEESGNSLADLLFGDVCPSGKLPTTFPKRLQDNPAYLNFPGENGKVLYGEGLYVGYRYYDFVEKEPMFPFGFGLSYTQFAYSDLKLSAAEFRADEGLEVCFTVRNTGAVTGSEVAQVYITDKESRLTRPLKELKGFAKLSLQPGEAREARVWLDRDAFSYYDDALAGWVAEPGEFEVIIGASSRDMRMKASVNLLPD